MKKVFFRYTCDTPDCKSYLIVGDEAPEEPQGWLVTWVPLSGVAPTHYCPSCSAKRLAKVPAFTDSDCCYCSDRMSGGLPCLPGKCPNVPKKF